MKNPVLRAIILILLIGLFYYVTSGSILFTLIGAFFVGYILKRIDEK